ncbi:MAG TPA: LysR substrate-binding domain-containing protein [Steroidobacteraceae bacterium]|nr:LysR substrate-binding domain-containing protein [Steroidobacteraceae bacterium]
MPSLRFLRTFHIAARRGSFKATADELCVTASAVSHQIKILEEELGLSLFERGPRSLTLTEAGTHYLKDIDALFSRLESVTEQLRGRFRRAIVRLRVPPFFASELLVPQLTRFSVLHNDVDLRIATDITPHDVHSPDADVSVVVGIGPWSGLNATRLFAQTYTVAASPQRLRQAPVSRAHDVADHPLIAHEHRLDLWDRWAAQQQIAPLCPKQLIRFDTMSAVVHAAERGVGIALVAAPLAVGRFAAGTLVRLFDVELDAGESYYLLTRPEDGERAAVRALIGWMVKQFGELRPAAEPGLGSHEN